MCNIDRSLFGTAFVFQTPVAADITSIVFPSFVTTPYRLDLLYRRFRNAKQHVDVDFVVGGPSHPVVRCPLGGFGGLWSRCWCPLGPLGLSSVWPQ